MRRIMNTLIAVLAILMAAPLASVAAQAVPAHASASAQAHMHATGAQDAGARVAVLASTTSPSPTDPASTGPANPGTGETGDAEATRVDYAPWVIGAVALVTLGAVLIWRRRRNTTIV